MAFNFSKFLSKNKTSSKDESTTAELSSSTPSTVSAEQDNDPLNQLIDNTLPESETTESPAKKPGWLSRFTQGLKRSRNQLSEGFNTLFLGKKRIDDEALESLETILLSADVGISVTQKILDHITHLIDRNKLDDIAALQSILKQELKSILDPCQKSLTLNATPFVILVVGVNGAGKTTTIAKMTHYFRSQGKRVMLAAGDTYRAAATEQLKTWGERNQVPVIAQQMGADSASVIFDAMQAATAREYDILIADTAGRLHTQSNLMNELSKIKRVLTKLNPEAPHEVMLIIDGTTGQNALKQAQLFHEKIGLTSLSVTKLDGTAKAGILFAIADNMKLPIRFIGLGEKIDDLKPFDSELFIDALFEQHNSAE